MRSLIFSKLYHNDNLELCKPMYSLDLIVFAVCGDSHIYIFIYCFRIIHHASPFQPVYFYVKENITFIITACLLSATLDFLVCTTSFIDSSAGKVVECISCILKIFLNLGKVQILKITIHRDLYMDFKISYV